MKIGLKVKEKIARVIGEKFSTNEIVGVFTDKDISTDASLYAKWRITLDAFGKIPTNEGFFSVIEEFCHPLNFSDSDMRKDFIDRINAILSYENLTIHFTERTAKIVPINEQSGEENIPQETSEPKKEEYVLPDIYQSTFSEKVLELVANEFTERLSNFEIRKIITPIIQKNKELFNQTSIKGYLLDEMFEENPFDTFNDTLQVIRRKDKNADETIAKIISTLLHPLNHKADDEKTKEIAAKIGGYLKYDNFLVDRLENSYLVYPEGNFDLPEDVASEIEQKSILHDKDTVYKKRDLVEELRKHHQAYMDILEVFCEDITHPTRKLNNAYLFLKNKIDNIVRELELKHYHVNPCNQFKGDLYSAEMEWNGDPTTMTVVLGPVLSWDAIRPSLYQTHSDITKLCNLSDEDTSLTDDEKKLEEITNLIAQQRTQKSPVNKGRVKQLEILHKYEKDSTHNFYITKNGDDFDYKGKYKKLSKKSDWYKVFYALYALLPEGGEIEYKKLISEIKNRIPKTKEKTEEEMRKFIQQNLTDKSNGFMRYAGIPETEDSGKPLIEILRDFGVRFNNRIG